jgi:choline dehydrogenase-like flavoprotein
MQEIPDIPSVPTNVTTIMMAERIAAKLSRDHQGLESN